MIIVISQPMLFPWVGMLEQIRAADVFVHYPDVQFSKGSFVNRVQIKTARGSRWLTVPLRDLRLGQRIDEVQINDQRDWRREHLQLLSDAYSDAPYLQEMLKLVESVYAHDYENIARLSEASLIALCTYFGLGSGRKFATSDTLGINGSGSGRVLDIVLALGGDRYLTGHGASRYLEHEAFEQAGVQVEYMDYAKIPYSQLHGEFTPFVSALDLVANTGSAGIDYIRPKTISWKDFYVMNEIEKFQAEVAGNIANLKQDTDVQALSRIWLREITRHKYAYNFSWLGRPLIQFPQDMCAIQELVWKVRPDLIIETGIAHGGSLILSASLLALLDYCDAVEAGKTLDPRDTHRRVLGIDIDIRSHNRAAIQAHPMAHRIEMIQGSSIAPEVIAGIHERARGYQNVLVLLDSNHTHAHVLAELEAYAPLVSKGSYCVVFDTLIEDMPADLVSDRPWGKGDNPKTAVREFLAHHPEFAVDEDMEAKILITVAPDGYLRRL